MITRPATRNRPRYCGRRLCVLPELNNLVMAHQCPAVSNGKYDAKNEQDHSDRAAETDLHAPHPEVVEIADHRVTGVGRSAPGQRDDQVKELEGPEHREEDRKPDRWKQQRYVYIPV